MLTEELLDSDKPSLRKNINSRNSFRAIRIAWNEKSFDLILSYFLIYQINKRSCNSTKGNIIWPWIISNRISRERANYNQQRSWAILNSLQMTFREKSLSALYVFQFANRPSGRSRNKHQIKEKNSNDREVRCTDSGSSSGLRWIRMQLSLFLRCF